MDIDKLIDQYLAESTPSSSRAGTRTGTKLRDMESPTVLGYELDRKTLTPIRRQVDTKRGGDHGADPLGNGMFRMVPSGDVVDFAERNRRLARRA